MNIFYLDEDPIIAAQNQCDKHVVKMILESAQMLCTAHHILDNDEAIFKNILYKCTHKNHPSTVWVRESNDNYSWLYNHFIALCDEYTFRYCKTHLTDIKFRGLLRAYPNNILRIGFTPIPLAMQNEPQCMIIGNPVESYRKYYHTKIGKMPMKWTRRLAPKWFEYK